MIGFPDYIKNPQELNKKYDGVGTTDNIMNARELFFQLVSVFLSITFIISF